MSMQRSIARSVAKHHMEQEGVTKMNRPRGHYENGGKTPSLFSQYWRQYANVATKSKKRSV